MGDAGRADARGTSLLLVDRADAARLGRRGPGLRAAGRGGGEHPPPAVRRGIQVRAGSHRNRSPGSRLSSAGLRRLRPILCLSVLPWLLAAGLSLLAAPAAPAATFVDDLGDTLRWQAPPERIVSLSPSLTELLFALGIDGQVSRPAEAWPAPGSRSRSGIASQTLVGVTRFCDHPPEAKKITVVGGIVDPSLEAIRSVNADLVLVTRGNPREFVHALQDLGIATYAVETNGSLRELIAAMARAARAVGRSAAGDSLAANLTQRLQRLESKTEPLAMTRKPRVYYGSVEPPYWTAGPGSTIDDIIRVAGGINVASGAPTPWCVYSLESIVAHDPQVLLGTYPQGREARKRNAVVKILAERPGWRDTQLGEEPRLCLIEEDLLMRPGPRILTAAERVAACLHPRLFPGAPHGE
ncbi:MAG: ABC transporter substrate-binding protein [Candidatus Eisenbacteria bacterium]|nr:ABC transporter substrate-binding protein [Candidatus Eisenbacteria bacterium]